MDKLDQIDQRTLLLKRGTRLLAKACGGNEAAGEIVGRSGESVRRWGDPAVPETIPVFFLAQLEAECGQPILTRMLAELAGHSLKPPTGEPAGACLASAHAEVMVAAADLTRTVVEAKRDGVITPNENAAIARAGVKAQAAVGNLMRAAGPGPLPPRGGQGPAPLSIVKDGG